MPKNYMTSLPQTTDTRKGFIQGADAPKVPAMDYRSGFRNVGEAVDNTNKFLGEYTKMKYEGFQADLDRLELEHLHEMQDATDPCELKEINEKWQKNYNTALKDDFLAKSYYKSSFYKKWQDRNHEAQQKIYYAKQHEFAEICATSTLNKMAETASMLDNPADVQQYLVNGEAMLANTKHLTAEAKYKLMTNFYKDTVSRLYESDPNKAVAFLDSVGNKYDAYGVSSEEIRNKAENYNKALRKEAEREQARLKKEAEEEAALVGQQGIALYNRGLKSKSEVEDDLWTLGMQSGNYKPYNDFMKATKPKSSSASKGADKEVVDKYTAGLSTVKTEDELAQYNYDFKTKNSDMSSATRAQINDISGEKEKIVMSFKAGNSGSSSTTEKITDNFGYTTGDVDIILETQNPELTALEFARKGNFTPTQTTRLTNEVKARVAERTKLQTEKESNYSRDIDNIGTESLNDTEAVTRYAQKQSEIDNDPSLDTVTKNNLASKINSERAKIIVNRKKANEESLKEKSALETQRDRLELAQNLTTAIQSGGYELADYNEKIVRDYEKNNLIGTEQANSLRTEIQNQRNYALDYRLSENNPVNPDDARKYNPKNPDEALKKIYAHNNTVYSNMFDKDINDTVKNVIFGKTTYEDGKKYILDRATSLGQDIDTAINDFDARIKDFDFANLSGHIMDSFERFYGDIDTNNKYAVSAKKQSKTSFYNELSKVWNDKKTLSAFNDEYVKGLAEQARVADNIDVSKSTDLMNDVRYIYSLTYSTTKEDRLKKQKAYDAKPEGDKLNDWDIVLKAKNNTLLQDEKINYVYDYLRPRINNLLSKIVDPTKTNSGINSFIQYARLADLDINVREGQIENRDTVDWAQIYEKVNPYLEANGYLISSQVGGVKNSNIALAVFIDQFEGITTDIIVGNRLYTKDEIKLMRERTKDVKRPVGR